MANAYCTVDQLCALYDLRVIGMLSNDSDSRTVVSPTVQLLLDMQASELDSYLDGRYDLTTVHATPPAVCMKFVGGSTMGRLYARRNDMPDEVKADVEWAADWVERVRKHEIKLPGIDPANSPFRIHPINVRCSITDRLPYL